MSEFTLKDIEQVKEQNEKYNYNYVRVKHTLCWDCANATGSCTWSRLLEPVEGWTAIKVKGKPYKLNPEINTDTYIVQACPEFIRDAENFGTQRIAQKEPKEDIKKLMKTEY